MPTFNLIDGWHYNDDDLRMKFEGSFLRLRLPSGDKVGQCIEFTDPAIKIDREVFHRKEIEILEEIPAVGISNFQNGIVAFTRSTRRQYKRGLNEGSANILMETGDQLHLTNDLAINIFDKKFSDFEVALDVLKHAKTKIKARALNTRYWLHKSPTTNEVLLMRNGLKVGIFSETRFWFNKNCDSLKQELIDDLNLDLK